MIGQQPYSGWSRGATQRHQGLSSRHEHEPGAEGDGHEREGQPPPSPLGPDGETQHGAVMCDEHPERPARRGHPLEVRDHGGGDIGDTPTGPAGPPAQIGVLGIHEVRLVEATELGQRPAASQEARTRHPVDLGDGVAVEVVHAVAPREAVPRHEVGECGVAGRVYERREATG